MTWLEGKSVATTGLPELPHPYQHLPHKHLPHQHLPYLSWNVCSRASTSPKGPPFKAAIVQAQKNVNGTYHQNCYPTLICSTSSLVSPLSRCSRQMTFLPWIHGEWIDNPIEVWSMNKQLIGQLKSCFTHLHTASMPSSNKGRSCDLFGLGGIIARTTHLQQTKTWCVNKKRYSFKKIITSSPLDVNTCPRTKFLEMPTKPLIWLASFPSSIPRSSGSCRTAG